MKKEVCFVFILFLVCNLIKAQATKANALQHELLVTSWFEAPRESHGDTIAYRLTQHIHVPEVDDPNALFSVVNFNTAPNFSVENWRWCPKSKFLYDGKWNIVSGNIIKLDFGAQKCKCQMTIITLQKEFLKVVIKTTFN